MKVISSIIIVFSLASCAQINTNNMNSPYEEFTTYVKLVQAKKYDSALLMLSSKNKQRFTNQENGEDFETFFHFSHQPTRLLLMNMNIINKLMI